MKDLESLWISVLLPDHDGITIEMANQVVFLKENERVKIPGFAMGEFLVFGEPTIERQTARLRLVSEPSIDYPPVPWAYLSYQPEE